MTPQEKLRLMRQAEISPGAALLSAIGILRGEMEAMIVARLAEIEAKLPETAVLKHIEKLTGPEGKQGPAGTSIDHSKVIRDLTPIVKSHAEKIIVQPKDGETPSDEKILSLIRPLIPEVNDGHTPTERELLSIIRPLIPDIAEMKPTDEELCALIADMLPKPVEPKVMTAEEIVAVIDKAHPSLTIDASRIRNLPSASRKKEKYHAAHGGGGGAVISGEQTTGSGQTTITLAHTPIAGTVAVYRGGARQNPGAGNDYTIAGKTITLSVALGVGEIVLIDYQY